ncbi:septal ring lytic transglycosylase RlpA family protein [Devosia geojensis]|uniref:septal ring lytic transglycosylase RlpA family protein n=1 Tax=Devosia geojensis TaxID=443610 RepID=UPI00069814D3|nr:septal ring lytic transglycosylase RlpA family protein [Devosia geojensis]
MPYRTCRLFILTAAAATVLAACSGGGVGPTVKRSAFTSSEYGVAVSPRVTNNPNPPKGGGRQMVGKPYTVRGKTYVPQENPAGYAAQGQASWYGADFHGRRTANGEIFSANAITAAHPTLPLPSYVRVTNQQNGRSVVVRVNDRGPYMPGRIIDLSHRAANMLGYVGRGSTDVQIEYVGPAPLEGDDTRMLMASYSGPAYQETGPTRVASASAGDRSLVGMTANFISGLFSYADTTPQAQDEAITSAHAAANAMATQVPELTQYMQALDADTRAVSIPLGIFANPNGAVLVAREFAVLGAVDEEQVEAGGAPATRLTLTRLKPGVAGEDVLALARQLGLGDVTL